MRTTVFSRCRPPVHPTPVSWRGAQTPEGTNRARVCRLGLTIIVLPTQLCDAERYRCASRRHQRLGHVSPTTHLYHTAPRSLLGFVCSPCRAFGLSMLPSRWGYPVLGGPVLKAVTSRRAVFWALHLRRAQKNYKYYPCKAVERGGSPIDHKNDTGGHVRG